MAQKRGGSLLWTVFHLYDFILRFEGNWAGFWKKFRKRAKLWS